VVRALLIAIFGCLLLAACGKAVTPSTTPPPVSSASQAPTPSMGVRIDITCVDSPITSAQLLLEQGNTKPLTELGSGATPAGASYSADISSATNYGVSVDCDSQHADGYRGVLQPSQTGNSKIMCPRPHNKGELSPCVASSKQ